MESASVESLALVPDELPPPALLRGTARGLEMIVQAHAGVDAVVAALVARLEEAPAFFRGSNVRIAVEGGVLASGCLARLDELAGRFELHIVEVAAAKAKARDAVPVANLAIGSAPSSAAEPEADLSLSTVLSSLAPTPEPPIAADSAAVAEPAAEPASASAAAAVAELLPTGPRVVVGPIRSGVILEHVGHLLIFGDVNPGAEVRATGGIIVLGRLSGTAHAGIGQDHGFILALRLAPQQLRIGRMVARAGDDAAATTAEIAYANQNRIVVERYAGKLPREPQPACKESPWVAQSSSRQGKVESARPRPPPTWEPRSRSSVTPSCSSTPTSGYVTSMS